MLNSNFFHNNQKTITILTAILITVFASCSTQFDKSLTSPKHNYKQSTKTDSGNLVSQTSEFMME